MVLLPNNMQKIKLIFYGVVIFLTFNSLLWGAQEVYYLEDTQRLKELDSQLSSLEPSINQEKTLLDAKRIELTELEAYGRIDEYNDKVDVFNTELTNYKKYIIIYNNQVNEYNTLNKKTETRWYLMPNFGASKVSKEVK